MKKNKFFLMITLIVEVMLVFSLIGCDIDNDPGKKNDPQVFVVDISQESNWDYIVVGKDGSSIVFRVDESSDVPTTMFLRPDKDSDDGFTYFFHENGLPDKMVANGIVFVFDNFNGYQFDFTVIYPDDTVEYVLGIETDVNWDAYGASGRRSIAHGRSAKDIKKGFEIIENVLGVGTCVGAAIPPLTAVLAIGCGAFVVDKIADAVIDSVFDGAMEDGAGVIKDSIGCVTGILKPTGILDCGQAVFGTADLITNEDKNLIEEIKDKIDDVKARKEETKKDFSITTESLPNGTVGKVYGDKGMGKILQSNGEYGYTKWEVVSGTLPPGLTLEFGIIRGTPTTAGTYNFTVKATYEIQILLKHKRSALKTFSITIKETPPAPTITTASLPNGTVGTPYARALSANGDEPIIWGLYRGTLPPGLSLSEKGTITGTPTTTGTFDFRIIVTNDGGSTAKEFSITIAPAGNTGNGRLTINNLPSGYSFAVYVFDRGTNISTFAGIEAALNSSRAASNAPSGSVFNLLTPQGVWTGSGNFPVLLVNQNGSETERANARYRWASVNFANGTGTANFSSFMAVLMDNSGTEANPIPLTAGVWAYGGISSSTDNTVWYSFSVGSGTTYYVWLDDADNAGGTLDASVGAFYSYGGNYIFTVDKDSRSFRATTSGTVKLLVRPTVNGYGDTGTFAVAYSTGSTKPGYGAGGGEGGGGNPTGGPTTWTVVGDSKFGSDNIGAIAYGGGRFVAVGYSGRMAYSTNGTTWTAVSDSTFGISAIQNIAYGNGRFIAGGGSGKMAYSTDGASWSTVSTSTFGTSTIFSIAYGNGKWVAGGGSGKMAYSTDGINWTTVSTTGIFGTSTISAIVYANNRFVAGGNAGIMAYSDDGTNWTKVADSTFSTSSTSGIRGIAYGSGKFVAVGTGGRTAYSTNGTSWTAVSNSTFGTTQIQEIAYGNNRFVAVGGSGKMAYSADGINWTAISTGIFVDSPSIEGIAYGGGKFVVVNNYGGMAYANW